MTERKLTPEEIEYLFTFVEQSDVKEYEIQAELVDHLASSIEIQLKQNTSTSFHEALNITYNDFGTNGFNVIVKTKRRMFRHKYNILFLKYLATYFQLPRIILTIALTISLFSVFRYFDESQSLLKSIGAIAIFLNFVYMAIIHPPHQLKGEKSFFINYYFKRLRIGTGLILIGLFYATMHSGEYLAVHKPEWLDLLISFLIVFIFIITYVLMIYMPKLLNQHFKKQFPDIMYSVL